MSELSSAPVPPPGPDDHGRGDDGAPVLIEYADYECPFCAALQGPLADLGVRLVFRHFPVRSSHPRAWAAAAAAEAAGAQGGQRCLQGGAERAFVVGVLDQDGGAIGTAHVVIGPGRRYRRGAELTHRSGVRSGVERVEDQVGAGQVTR